MPKLSWLPMGVLALTIAAPVMAQPITSPSATTPAPTATPAKPATVTPQAAVAPKAGMVDINTASSADLKALPGMTEGDAAKVVQGRPYKDPADLVGKKILSEAQFSKIKDRLTAGHPKS